jgi:hypothetical protein
MEFDPSGEEPEVLAFVRDYWHRSRGQRAMPGRQDISPAGMKPYLRHILLVDVIEGGRDFRYRLVGDEAQRFFASNPTGRLMSEALAPFGKDTVEATLGVYRAVDERRAPLRIRGPGAYFAQGAKLCDALLTPLSDDGIDANMILGTFTFVWDEAVRSALQRGAQTHLSDLERALR